MSRRILSLALSGFIAIIIINWSCTKLDTTTIGSDLLPAVDNINTFADTFAINTTEAAFADTTRLQLTDNFALGKNNDPIFGGTDATLFLQLKPGFYPYYVGLQHDTIVSPDSVVLCLSYKSAYGDTSVTPIKLQVFEVPFTVHGDWDSLDKLHDINYTPTPTLGAALSPETPVNIAALGVYKKIGTGTDSVINQIRIRLTDAGLISRLFFLADTLYPNGSYSRDSMFRTKVSNGFAVKMTQGNAILYTQLSDPNTRLELHYKSKNGGPADTSMAIFTFNTGVSGGPRRSAAADNIVRTRPMPLPAGDQEILLQSSPGTYASLKIPQLTGYTNRVIHRAEIIMEQIPAASDQTFPEPGYLYLDLVDSGTVGKWKPIYYDLNPSLAYDPDNISGLPYFPVTGEVDLGYLGATPKKIADGSAPSGFRSYYTLNITRYLQQLVTKQTPNYEIRVYAPHDIIYPQYAATIYPYVNNIAQGRVRLGGGNNADPTYRMRLRIVYSKLK